MENEDGYVVIGTEVDTKSFDSQINDIERRLEEIDTILSQPKDFEISDDEFVKLSSEAEKLKNRLIDLRIKQEQLNNPSNGALNWMKNIGKETDKVIKKVGKWALAIFGIRSIYNLIRQAVSTLASEDEQIATDLEYMKWVLAQTLKPVVEWLIQALYYVLNLLNRITTELFGLNFLLGKGVENFKEAKKNSGGISKNLKEANKQLAGFDEMNVLQDNTTSGGGGVLDNWEPPDISGFEQQVDNIINEWQKFGNEMKDTLDNAPLMAWINGFGLWGIAVRGATQTVYGLWQVIDGIVNYIKNASKLIKGLIDGDTNAIKEAIVNMFLSSQEILKGTIDVALGLLQGFAGIVMGIFGTIGQWIWYLIVETINDILNRINNGLEKAKSLFMGLYNFVAGIIKSILSLFGSFGTSIGNAIAGAFKLVVNSALGAIENILNNPIKAINSLIGTINKIPGINLSKMNTFKLPRLAKGGIINMPGRGVPVGAIGGENGKEGVIPLTDSQQMALLGEAIGRYITINANITNTMNGRVISRELQKVQNDSDFAYNR